MALHLQGYALDHPVMQAGLDGLDGFTIEDDAGRRIEACQSPVWDTALAVVALADAGVAPDDPRSACGRTLVGCTRRSRSRGTGPCGVPTWPPGAGPSSSPTTTTPTSTTRRRWCSPCAGRMSPTSGAVARAVDWTVGMQCRDGGWGAFDVDNTRALCRELPFCDFGELIDPPSADVTAHVVEMLSILGHATPAPRPPPQPTRPPRGVAWLLEAQEPDGSWFGRWGVNHLYGTGAVVPALIAAGISPRHPAVRRAVAWVEAHQNDDGGWGEDLRSYRDPGYRGRGHVQCQPDRLGPPGPPGRGRAWSGGANGAWTFSSGRQRADGTWDETWFTGTGFPGDFYINYHLYHLVFPVMALGRYVRGWDRG